MKLNPEFEEFAGCRGCGEMSEPEKKALIQKLAIEFFRPQIECLQIVLERCHRWLHEHDDDPVNIELMFGTVGLHKMRELDNDGVIRELRTKVHRNDLNRTIEHHLAMASRTLRLAFGGA